MYRALLICNSVFPLEPVQLPRLSGPVRDGLAMWSTLTDPETGLFLPENVEVHFESEKADILEAAEKFFRHSDPDDVLLFYYSGHGKRHRSNLYLCARNTTVDLLFSSSIPGAELRSIMEATPARSVIVILDCCHSGAFKGDPPRIPPEPLSGKGRYVMTASGAAEPAIDAEPGSPSPFTRALVEGLRRAEPGSRNPEFLVVQDVYDYAYRAIPDGVPKPQRKVDGAGDTAIAARPAAPVEDLAEVSSRAPVENAGNKGTAELPSASPVSLRLQGLGFAGDRMAQQSLGDRLSWRVFLLVSFSIGFFCVLSWEKSRDLYVWSDGVDVFFVTCLLLAMLSVIFCVIEAAADGDSRVGRVMRAARVGTGLAFGALWLESVVDLGLDYAEQALLQTSIGFYFLAAVLTRFRDSLFLAATLVSFAGVFAPGENLGYDVDGFDMILLLQALISLAMAAFWYLGGTERHFATLAACGLAPVFVSFVVHGVVPGVSLYGTALALLSALLGDGTRPAEGSRSMVGSVIRRADRA